jgi:hypothetical protein
MSRTAGKIRRVSTIVYDVVGAASGVLLAELPPIGQDAIISRAWLDVTTVATAACTVDLGIGDSATDTADARSDDILDGIDVHTAVGRFDNFTLDLAGATAIMTPIDWVDDDYLLLHVKTGNGTGLVGKLYVEFTWK